MKYVFSVQVRSAIYPGRMPTTLVLWVAAPNAEVAGRKALRDQKKEGRISPSVVLIERQGELIQ